MLTGIVIDAHLIPAFRKSLVAETGTLFELINWILDNCHLVVTPYIENHWKQKCPERDQFFWKWYEQKVVNHEIVFLNNPKRLNGELYLNLCKDYKIPKDCFIRAYLDCADNIIAPRYIISEDLYFYDPCSGSMTVATQTKIKITRSGVLCKHLERHLRIRIGSCDDCSKYFEIHKICEKKNSGCEENCFPSS